MTSIDTSKFQRSRLIPVTGIKGALDQERRATSALLAVISIVPDFAAALMKTAGAFKGAVTSYIEPEFQVGTKKIRPDGLVVIQRGKRQWSCLVEVKTGKNELDLNQLHSYLDICRDNKIDALVTISNQVPNASGRHPTDGIDQRKLRSTRLEHYSWIRIITEAIVQAEHDGVEDREQDFVMKELIRFLQSDASGASEFNDMGPSWTAVREGVRNSTIRKPDESVAQVIANFESLIRYSALTLSARLGVNASEVVRRQARENYPKHLQEMARELVDGKRIGGSIQIPGAAADLEMGVDLSAGVLHCGFKLNAPRIGRNSSRINWLLRQIGKAPEGTLVSWAYKRSRSYEAPHRVNDLVDKNYKFDLPKVREISEFRVETIARMGTKRASGNGSFIDSVVDLFELVYGELLQDIRAWQDPAPRLSETVKEIIPEKVESLSG